jgi:hypothetical protein
MLRHIDSLLDECASVTDVVALVSVLTGNSRISVPDDIIFAFGDWEEQDARVAIDRLTQLHRWRRKGAKKMADEVNLARGKLRQHEEMVAPPVEVGVDLSAYFPYLSPFVKEAKGAHAVGGADKLAERWARLIRIAFDLGMADEAIVALLRGPARGVLSLISEMALLDHFESTAHTETSSEGVDQEKGEEEETRAGGVGDEEGEAHQSHWLMVAAGLVSRHVTVRRRALWYWALECSEEDEGLEEGALQVTSSLLCRIDLQYLNSDISCRAHGLMRRLMARVLRAMDPPPLEMANDDKEEEEEGDSMVGSVDLRSPAAASATAREMTRSPLLPLAPSSTPHTPRRLSMRRRSTVGSATGFGGLLAMFRRQQISERNESPPAARRNTTAAAKESAASPPHVDELDYLPSTATLRFFIALLSLQRCEVESGFLLMHFFDTCSGLRNAGAAWAVLEHFLRSRTAGLPAGNGDMYLKSRGRRLQKRTNASRGRGHEFESEFGHEDEDDGSLFDVYEYSVTALEETGMRKRDGEDLDGGEHKNGPSKRKRVSGAFYAFKIMDRAARCLGVD